jgi:O-antigen ligase
MAAPDLLAAYGRRIADMALYFRVAPDALLSGRLDTWTALLSRLAHHPAVLLTGIGFKTLPYSHYLGPPLIVDNMYLSLLAETGIPGLLLTMALTAAILTTGVRARRRGGDTDWFCGTWLICSWVGNLAQMLSVDVLTYWRVLPLTFFLWALTRRKTQSSGAA